MWGSKREQIICTVKPAACIQAPFLWTFWNLLFQSPELISGETQVSHLMIIASLSARSSHPWVPVISTSPNQLSVFACHCIHGYGSPRYLLRLQREKIKKEVWGCLCKICLLFWTQACCRGGDGSDSAGGWRDGRVELMRITGSVRSPLQPPQLCWWKLANEFLGGLISKNISHCLELSNI